MKNLILIALVLGFGRVATAAPKVGDFERWQLTGDTGGKSKVWESKEELISFDAWAKFISRQTITDPGGTDKVYDRRVTLRDLKDTQNEAKQIWSNCVQKGGHLELIRVPAGPFRACKISSSSPRVKDEKWVYPGPLSGYVRTLTTSAIINVDQRLLEYKAH